MIRTKKGNILQANTQALINTVNTVGVMGKGIALQFKEAFPENFRLYKKSVESGEVSIGKMFVYRTNRIDNVQFIINFPTKKEWFRPSSYSWIEEGLADLVRVIEKYEIKSIAVPPLGCGNGKLDWAKVRPMILKYLDSIENLEVVLYEPDEKVQALLQEEDTKKEVALTPVRAMLLYTLFYYEALGEEASLFSANKICYFLQRFGEKQLRLNFKRHHFGPYSNQVDHLMHLLNGKYLRGLAQMEAKPFDPLKLNYDFLNEIKDYFEHQLGSQERAHVTKFIEFIVGFESSMALELLSSIDSYLQENPAFTSDQVFEKLQTWSDRKKKLFDSWHVETAYKHLLEYRQDLYPELAIH